MKVLVTSSSKYGATEEIGEAVARRLGERGLDVDVTRPADVDRLDDYDVVVLGSGVYAGQWIREARTFVEVFADDLRAMPVWLFSSGPVGEPPVPASEPAGVAPIVEAIAPREHRVFAGRLDPGSLNIAERTVLKVVRAEPGDFRDWDDVTAWADAIADQLAAGIAVLAE